MVLFIILDLGINILWWSCKQTYNGIHRMIYGKQDENKILMIEMDKLIDKINELEKKLE